MKNLLANIAVILIITGLLLASVKSQAQPLDQTVLKVYTAEWCGWCKKLKPELDKLSLDNVCVEYVIMTEEIAKSQNIKGIPVIDVYDARGNFKVRILGFKTSEQLKKAIEEIK